MEKQDRRIFIVGGDKNYANWMGGTIVDNIIDSNLVVFTGGEDVDPSMYKHVKNPRTYSNLKRDQEEAEIFSMARNLGKKMIGICRGSQFLCVMSGGTLIQHQQNPSFVHDMWVTDIKFNHIPVTSTHHQAQNPYTILGTEYSILAWTTGLVGKKENGLGIDMPNAREIEIVYYKKTDCLGIQCHPEMMYGDEQFGRSMQYLNGLLDKLMNNNLR